MTIKKYSHKWSPLSLLNFKTKLLLSSCKKNYLTLPLKIKISIIKYGNIGKKRKQIFDFMEIINTLTIGGFHLTLDFKKAVYFTK